MVVFGWIALVVFAIIGLGIIVYAVTEFCIVQARLFHARIGKELEIMKEDINKTGELKKTRLAEKREAKHRMAKQKLDAQLSKMQRKTDQSTYGEQSHAQPHKQTHAQSHEQAENNE